MIVIACDSYKEFASSLTIGNLIKRGIESVVSNNIKVLSISDGGDGFLESMSLAKDSRYLEVRVNDPLCRITTANYSLKDNVAIIEMAEASGVKKFSPNERHFLDSSSYGTGELIKKSLENGCKKIYLGLGGAATADAGIGAASALGVRFISKFDGLPIQGKCLSAKHLPNISDIDFSRVKKKYRNVEVIITYDVTNKAIGQNGASYTFGPQKGGTTEQIKMVEDATIKYMELLESKLGYDLNLPGTGAAGALSLSLFPIFRVSMQKGIDVMLDQINFSEHLKNASLVITGEGRLDKLSLLGKAPIHIANYCKSRNIKVIGVFGQIDKSLDLSELNFDIIIDASDGSIVEFDSDYFQNIKGPELIYNAGVKIGKLYA